MSQDIEKGEGLMKAMNTISRKLEQDSLKFAVMGIETELDNAR
jgi:hypothetical protein